MCLILHTLQFLYLLYFYLFCTLIFSAKLFCGSECVYFSNNIILIAECVPPVQPSYNICFQNFCKRDVIFHFIFLYSHSSYTQIFSIWCTDLVPEQIPLWILQISLPYCKTFSLQIAILASFCLLHAIYMCSVLYSCLPAVLLIRILSLPILYPFSHQITFAHIKRLFHLRISIHIF